MLQQEYEDTQVKLHSQSQELKQGEQSSSERSERPAGCVLQWRTSAAVPCGDIIRDPVILPCNLWSLSARKGGQRRVWRMSCLVWILTGACNVGHTQWECPRRKADRWGGKKADLFLFKVFIFNCYVVFKDAPVWFLSRQAWCKKEQAVSLLFCWQLTDVIMGQRWQVRQQTCHLLSLKMSAPLNGRRPLSTLNKKVVSSWRKNRWRFHCQSIFPTLHPLKRSICIICCYLSVNWGRVLFRTLFAHVFVPIKLVLMHVLRFTCFYSWSHVLLNCRCAGDTHEMTEWHHAFPLSISVCDYTGKMQVNSCCSIPLKLISA